jgi:hypothetical protein
MSDKLKAIVTSTDYTYAGKWTIFLCVDIVPSIFHTSVKGVV